MSNDAIAKIYADLVRAGRREREDVPGMVREQVEQMLGTDQDDA